MKGLEQTMERDPLTVYSPFEFISLVFITSRGWHKNVAQPPCRGTVHHFTKEPCKLYTHSIRLPGHTDKTWYLQQWSWKESVWVCYLPSCLFPRPAAWPGRNTPTKGGENKGRRRKSVTFQRQQNEESVFSLLREAGLSVIWSRSTSKMWP